MLRHIALQTVSNVRAAPCKKKEAPCVAKIDAPFCRCINQRAGWCRKSTVPHRRTLESKPRVVSTGAARQQKPKALAKPMQELQRSRVQIGRSCERGGARRPEAIDDAADCREHGVRRRRRAVRIVFFIVISLVQALQRSKADCLASLRHVREHNERKF